MKKKKKKEIKSSHLHNAADDLGKHVEGKPEDVEKREGHKGLLCIQDVVLIHCHKHSEGCQGNLERQMGLLFLGESTLQWNQHNIMARSVFVEFWNDNMTYNNLISTWAK